MDILRAAALILATVTMGVMAGVFQLYAYAIMPGLGLTNDRTFVGAFQVIDTAISNPLFLGNFFGALLLTGLAAVLHIGADEEPVLPWTVAALILYVVVVVSTMTVNVPLNDAIKAAGDPDRIDLAAVRGRFDEAKWTRWNLVRAVLTTAALACLAWALVLYGRL
jgi:uncharacterized membrane protein